MRQFALGLRSALDRVYLASGVVAALFLIAILSLIVLQMLARWTGEVFQGAPDYAGYCMAAASFFAFAHALNRGAHIRVSILLNALSRSGRRILETWCFAIGEVVLDITTQLLLDSRSRTKECFISLLVDMGFVVDVCSTGLGLQVCAFLDGLLK